MLRYSSLLLLLASCASALPGYQEDGSFSSSSCPIQQTGAELEEALSQAATRREAWEVEYPSETFERKYTPGLKNGGEVYCDANEDQAYCNKMHGPWGDSIPQDEGVYCLWAILEFQDPPEFNYGQFNANSSAFNSIFQYTLDSVKSDVPQGGILAVGAGGPDESNPWPVSSIIWKSGNKYAKPWIRDFHRPDAQVPGYNFGFTFHGHYKAVKCETILPAIEANGLSVTDDFDNDAGFMYMKWDEGNFRKYWNAFSDLVDLSDQFVKDECVSECSVGPCPDSDKADAEESAVWWWQKILKVDRT